MPNAFFSQSLLTDFEFKVTEPATAGVQIFLGFMLIGGTSSESGFGSLGSPTDDDNVEILVLVRPRGLKDLKSQCIFHELRPIGMGVKGTVASFERFSCEGGEEDGPSP